MYYEQTHPPVGDGCGTGDLGLGRLICIARPAGLALMLRAALAACLLHEEAGGWVRLFAIDFPCLQ